MQPALDFVNRLLSEVALQRAKSVSVAIATETDLSSAEKLETVAQALYQFVERLDDNVTAIPALGWLARIIVDNPVTDGWQLAACRTLAELLYQGWRDAPALDSELLAQ